MQLAYGYEMKDDLRENCIVVSQVKGPDGCITFALLSLTCSLSSSFSWSFFLLTVSPFLRRPHIIIEHYTHMHIILTSPPPAL